MNKQYVYAALGMGGVTGLLVGFLFWVGAFSDHGPKPVPLQAIPVVPPQAQQPAPAASSRQQPPVVSPQPTPAPPIQAQQSPKVVVTEGELDPEDQAALEAEAAELLRQAKGDDSTAPVSDSKTGDQTAAPGQSVAIVLASESKVVQEQVATVAAAVTEPLLTSGYVNLPIETVRTHIARPDLTLVRVSASWCGPCKQSHGPLYEYAANGGLAFHVDADEHPAFAKEYQVSGMPTYLLFRGGDLVGRHSGALFSLADLKAMIARKDNVTVANN